MIRICVDVLVAYGIYTHSPGTIAMSTKQVSFDQKLTMLNNIHKDNREEISICQGKMPIL